MAETAARTMTPAEFSAWQENQHELYELVRGTPVPRSITGATQRHDIVVINAILAFGPKLRGTGCRPSTSDIALVPPKGNVRRPDMTIDCGSVDPASTEVGRPVLVLEVLSPSTEQIDRFEKLEEYKTVPDLEYILIAEAGSPHVMLYWRGEDRAWTYMSHIGTDSILDLPKLGCTLSLAELYEGVPAPDRAEPKGDSR